MLLFGTPGPGEWVVIFFVFLLLFGGSKLPELGRSLGEGIREFRKALNGRDEQEDKKNKNIPDK